MFLCLCPAVGKKTRKIANFHAVHSAEHVRQVLDRVDALHVTGGYEREEDCGGATAFVGADKEKMRIGMKMASATVAILTAK